MPPVMTPTFLYADSLFAGNLTHQLKQWVKSGLSPGRIASRLYAATDGKIDVTDETVRQWLLTLNA